MSILSSHAECSVFVFHIWFCPLLNLGNEFFLYVRVECVERMGILLSLVLL